MNKIKECIKKIWLFPAEISFFILNCYLICDEKKFYNTVLKREIGKIEKHSSYFMSYNLRPKKSDLVISIEKGRNDYRNIAIVIQGPIEKSEEFTVETVKLYKKIFPGVCIIVSCWEDDDPIVVKTLRNDLKVECIQSKKPVIAGFCNLNLQISSTMAGIKKAKELGVKYVFKTRSDMRIYQIGTLDFLVNIVENFPVEDKNAKMEKRIVTADFRCSGTQFWPFFVGDQWGFGTVDDMVKYWDMNFVEDGKYSAKTLQTKNSQGKYLFTKKERVEKHLFAEGNIVLDFWKRQNGEEIDISIKNYWEFVRKYIVVVDRRILDFYWYKYDIRYEENLHNGSYRRDDSQKTCYTYSWNYLNWYNHYCGSLKYDDNYEKMCETHYY